MSLSGPPQKCQRPMRNFLVDSIGLLDFLSIFIFSDGTYHLLSSFWVTIDCWLLQCNIWTAPKYRKMGNIFFASELRTDIWFLKRHNIGYDPFKMDRFTPGKPDPGIRDVFQNKESGQWYLIYDLLCIKIQKIIDLMKTIKTCILTVYPQSSNLTFFQSRTLPISTLQNSHTLFQS